MFVYCNDINKEKPEFGQTVLVKIKQDYVYDDTSIYVCKYVEFAQGDGGYFEEALGERWMKWDENEIECWVDAKSISDDMYVLEEWK